MFFAIMIIGINVYKYGFYTLCIFREFNMIEAVNSVLSNASVIRVAAEQQSTVRSYAANPERIQEAAKAPYLSQHIALDGRSNKAVLQIRDTDTGDVLRQFPTEGQLKAYRVAQQFSDRRAAEAKSNAVKPQSVSTGNNQVPSTSGADTKVAAPQTVSAPAAPSTSSSSSSSSEIGVSVKTEA